LEGTFFGIRNKSLPPKGIMVNPFLGSLEIIGKIIWKLKVSQPFLIIS